MANVGVVARIFQRKSVELIHAETDHGELKRSLGALNLVLLGIGCIIGTGIFVLTGHAAAEWAGPGIMISFVITGLLCAFVALCYAELASALPVSGSAYSYSYASMGEVVAWIMGLLLLLEYGLAASTVAVGWSGYLVSLLKDMHILIPPELTAAPGTRSRTRPGSVIAHGVVNLPAMLGIARGDLPAGHRRLGVGDGQQRHRLHQADGGHRLHRHRRLLRAPGPLVVRWCRRRCRRRRRHADGHRRTRSAGRCWT